MFVHTAGFVHKKIRPDTIIIFQDKESTLAKLFLVGFERFRLETGGTTKLQTDLRWEKNLYRHPRRQGLSVEDVYVMQHDIYSLGVCLFEIDLWESLVCPAGENNKPGLGLDMAESLSSGDVGSASEVRLILTKMALERLPEKMGKRYASLVVSCLTYLDPEETNAFAKESDLVDEDGIVVGIAYIEKVELPFLFVPLNGHV